MLNCDCQKFKEENTNRAQTITLKVEQLKTLVMVSQPLLYAYFSLRPLASLNHFLIWELSFSI
jgi:hypothetical protein